MTNEFVTVSDGAQIFLRRQGTRGPIVVLLHGNGEDGRIFSELSGVLSRNFQVVIVDSRGHGQSTLGQKPLTLVQMKQDLEEILKIKKFEQIVLVGFSRCV